MSIRHKQAIDKIKNVMKAIILHAAPVFTGLVPRRPVTPTRSTAGTAAGSGTPSGSASATNGVGQGKSTHSPSVHESSPSQSQQRKLKHSPILTNVSSPRSSSSSPLSVLHPTAAKALDAMIFLAVADLMNPSVSNRVPGASQAVVRRTYWCCIARRGRRPTSRLSARTFCRGCLLSVVAARCDSVVHHSLSVCTRGRDATAVLPVHLDFDDEASLKERDNVENAPPRLAVKPTASVVSGNGVMETPVTVGWSSINSGGASREAWVACRTSADDSTCALCCAVLCCVYVQPQQRCRSRAQASQR